MSATLYKLILVRHTDDQPLKRLPEESVINVTIVLLLKTRGANDEEEEMNCYKTIQQAISQSK